MSAAARASRSRSATSRAAKTAIAAMSSAVTIDANATHPAPPPHRGDLLRHRLGAAERVTYLDCDDDGSTFEPSDGAAFAIALLNTWDELEPDPECLRDVGVAQRLLTRHGLADAARVARAADVDWLRGLRERLGRAWDAANEETAVAELNTILAGASAQPWLARDSGGAHSATTGPARRSGSSATPSPPGAARGDRERTLAAVRPVRRGAVPLRLHRSDRSAVRRYCCRLCADRAAHQAFRSAGSLLTSRLSYRQ